jgi:hypothetical protein
MADSPASTGYNSHLILKSHTFLEKDRAFLTREWKASTKINRHAATRMTAITGDRTISSPET